MDEKIRSYRDLRVWQLGMDVAAACYDLTKQFPREEMFGMTSQIRRSAASVPANIAEGYGRQGKGEYIQYLRIAQGSLKETETHLLLAARVGLTTDTQVQPLLESTDQLGRMLHKLIASLMGR